ncbi:MAG: TRAP transporter permease [Oscillospiraceae bacterium]
MFSKWWASKSVLFKIAAVLGIALLLFDLAYIGGLLARLGINIMIQPYRGLNLGIFIVLTYIVFPPKKGMEKRNKIILVIDITLMLMGVIPCLYYFFFYDLVLKHIIFAKASMLEIVFFVMLLIALLEGGRRAVGLPMVIVVLVFLCHALFSQHFPGMLYSRSIPFPRLVLAFFLDSNGVYGLPMGVASTTVIVFSVFAGMLMFSGGGKFFIDFALSILGAVRGGPAKVAVIASACFGTLSGSTASNVAATGSITIPLMKNTGYDKNFAGAVEAVASNGGQIMPPVMGAVAFVMAEMTGFKYIEICFAALLPAILYYMALFTQIDLEALKRGLKGVPKEQVPSVKETLKKGWQYLVPIIALIVFLAVFRFTPEKSALLATGILIVVSQFQKESRLNIIKIVQSLDDTARSLCTVVLACGMACVIMSALNSTGVGMRLAMGLVQISGGRLLVLALLVAVCCFIMGMGLGNITIYLTLSALVGPAMIELGVPVMAAHMFILYWGIVAFITPPVCIAAYVAASISGGSPMKTGLYATRLGICTYIVPFMFIYNPVLVMIGEPLAIIQATVTSIIGVVILSAGIVGHLYVERWGSLTTVERIIYIAGGIGMLIPGLLTDLLGVGIVAVAFLVRILLKRKGAHVEA